MKAGSCYVSGLPHHHDVTAPVLRSIVGGKREEAPGGGAKLLTTARSIRGMRDDDTRNQQRDVFRRYAPTWSLQIGTLISQCASSYLPRGSLPSLPAREGILLPVTHPIGCRDPLFVPHPQFFSQSLYSCYCMSICTRFTAHEEAISCREPAHKPPHGGGRGGVSAWAGGISRYMWWQVSLLLQFILQ